VIGHQVHAVQAGSEDEFDKAFATFAQLKAGALLVGLDVLFISRRDHMRPTDIAKALRIGRASVYRVFNYEKKFPILRYHRLVSRRPRERALAPATAAWKYGLWIQYPPIPDSVAMHCSRLVK